MLFIYNELVNDTTHTDSSTPFLASLKNALGIASEDKNLLQGDYHQIYYLKISNDERLDLRTKGGLDCNTKE